MINHHVQDAQRGAADDHKQARHLIAVINSTIDRQQPAALMRHSKTQ